VYSRLEQQQNDIEGKGMRREPAFSLPDQHNLDGKSDHTAEQEPAYDVVDDLLQKWTTVAI
jgi:hypothetical protein